LPDESSQIQGISKIDPATISRIERGLLIFHFGLNLVLRIQPDFIKAPNALASGSRGYERNHCARVPHAYPSVIT